MKGFTLFIYLIIVRVVQEKKKVELDQQLQNENKVYFLAKQVLLHKLFMFSK